MNYTIITDREKLEEFIDWLPELKDNEKFYCSLFARKKYCQDLIKSNDKTQLKRFTSNKDRLLEKIEQLEIKKGTYKLRGHTVPQESLVLYINPNPRCMKRATFQMMNKCLKLIEHDNNNYNIHAEALSCIQRSKGTTHFVDFDIDDKTVDLVKLNTIIPPDCYDIIETRGGYHVLVNPIKATVVERMWYRKILETFDCDQVGDQMIPIPGSVQGGFTPKFI